MDSLAIWTNGKTSLQAITEVLYEKLVPRGGGSFPYVDEQNILEIVRNAYAQVVSQMYLSSMASEGDRSVSGTLLERAQYPVADSVSLAQFSIATLPRDAGIDQVIALDAKGRIVGDPYVRTQAVRAYNKPKLLSGYRYYPLGEELYFPDGHDSCTATLEVVCVGTLDSDTIRVPRDVAALTFAAAWQMAAPGREIPADITANQNPNQ